MARKRKPPRSRLREKAARGPQAFSARYERIISKYLEEVVRLQGEPARSHRFSVLLSDLFAELEFPIITDYLAGLEKSISATDAGKCRVSRGQPDALFGNLVVEFERRFPEKYKEARKQLQKYVAILRKNPGTQDIYFTPIATDGISFRVFAPEEGELTSAGGIGDEVQLEEVENFDASKRQPIEFYYWLDRYFCRRVQREPLAENFVEDFGTASPAYREASALWLEKASEIREHTDFKVIYENWRNYLRIAYGTAVGDQSLFIRHTFLATLAKLIAYIRITDAKSGPGERAIEEIIQGTFFEKQGILNFLEEDFFSWMARAPVASTTHKVATRLVSLLFTYNLRELSEDVLKELYQELVDPKDRHDLGEYYTPDWLATRMCEKLLANTGEQSVLDPACGSGTFLYQAIQHKKKRLPATRLSLEKILGNVVGIDIHPLAVIVSKMNVLLALGDLFQKRAGPVSIQVYLANSIRHPEKQPVLGNGGLPAERVILNRQEVLIPDAVLSSAATLDAAVRVADEFAKSHKEETGLEIQAFENLLRREACELADSPEVVHMLFDVARVLHEFIRKPEDTIWAYILKNLYKPTFLAHQFDVVIGNPPWLSFRFVEKGEYQDFLKRLIIDECRLLEGAGHLITHLELGTLFFVRCASLYLKATGRIGFVLPRSIFTADQHDRFRRSMASGNATLTEVWDLDGVTPLFNVPAAVALGDVQSEASKVLRGEIVAGELKRKNASWAEAKAELSFERTDFHVVQQGKRTFLSTSRKKISVGRSYYQPFFKEGATIVPRNFWFIEFKARSKLGIDPKQPLVATDPRAEAEAKVPYKGTYFEGAIEAEFLYATLLSTDLLPFGHFDFRPVVLPLVEDVHGYKLLDAQRARAEGYLRLAEWLERAQETWTRKRKEKAGRMDIYQRLDLQRGLTGQDPKAKFVVLYPMSATYLCAAAVAKKMSAFEVGEQRILPGGFVADYVNFYFETNDHDEAQYVTAILNAPLIDSMLKPLQARGLWGPRHICKKVLELPIPEFRESNRKHTRLVEVGQECQTKVAEMISPLGQLFKDIRPAHAIGRARTAVRQALKEELAEIDSIVKEVLK
ncbi:MAG: SAM-dependent DNA methyltransferase [Acidobacteria bacterium]|nr:SAM-dependent DNA methyltransferase [Acidobacteriota bacterium]